MSLVNRRDDFYILFKFEFATSTFLQIQTFSELFVEEFFSNFCDAFHEVFYKNRDKNFDLKL